MRDAVERISRKTWKVRDKEKGEKKGRWAVGQAHSMAVTERGVDDASLVGGTSDQFQSR